MDEEKKELSTLGTVKHYLSQETTKNRFNEVLGKKAPQFITSIINAVGSSTQLQSCEPASIVSAALVAAALDLPIDPNLGYSALVPYGNGKTNEKRAQFQMMYKGFIQLAIRSGQYKEMGVSEIYEDEIEEYDPIFGKVYFAKKKGVQRENGEKDKIVGYFAYFDLISGFHKELYMTKEECRNHAETYSASYRQDLVKKWSSSKWTTNFDDMAKKTVIKQLISKWGIMTVEMQRAVLDDQKIFDNEDGTYADNPERREQRGIYQAQDVYAQSHDQSSQSGVGSSDDTIEDANFREVNEKNE